jgi:hypothetical protein
MQTPIYALLRTYTRSRRPGFIGHCDWCNQDITPDHDTAFTTPGIFAAAMGDHGTRCLGAWFRLFEEVGA